ncbi:putative U5 small nuclear ribonucleoprotein [Sesbania bispinosa]|nr:putative U5 small nuclear ribonucleoprotein [Sesbania bispinosa]
MTHLYGTTHDGPSPDPLRDLTVFQRRILMQEGGMKNSLILKTTRSHGCVREYKEWRKARGVPPPTPMEAVHNEASPATLSQIITTMTSEAERMKAQMTFMEEKQMLQTCE